MKTPSFLELKILVEFLNEELCGAQLQDVISTDEGLVLSFYRFSKEPKMVFLVFDLDKLFPFLGIFFENPWVGPKKTKPVSLFLNAHCKNHRINSIELVESLGRVVKISLQGDSYIEFRLIPKHTNFIIYANNKSISWYPIKELAAQPVRDAAESKESEDEIRSINFMMNQWLRRRGRGVISEPRAGRLSPYEKWKANREKDLAKKKKALVAIRTQIDQFKNEEWSQVGEYLKTNGFKKLKPEWSVYVDFDKTVSQNIQKCFEKSKAAKTKIHGAEVRFIQLEKEINELSDITENKFEQFLKIQNQKKSQHPQRRVEGRLRKYLSEDQSVLAYMGKSAADNMDLLRKSKPHDLWLHLKDYPSAHAIIHLQKNQKLADLDVKKVASWLIKEGLSDKSSTIGGKYSVVVVECRHVKPLKGDKLGRVTYHNAREFLIAI